MFVRRCGLRGPSGVAAVAVATTLLVAPTGAATPHGGGNAPVQRCEQIGHAARADTHVPHPSAAEVRTYERRFASAYEALPMTERRAAHRSEVITVPVHVHAIQAARDKVRATRERIKKQIRIMNRAYRGEQDSHAARTRFRFRLRSIERHVNRRWYEAGFNDRAAKQMKRRLHRGSRGSLNLYLSAPEWSWGVLNGWATFPAEYARHPRLDGVVINYGAMPGGTTKHRNRGDTAVHETGHWLGLYHTFQGGCGKPNDRVRDTPRERGPAYRCPKRRDTCTAPGRDPVHNFMDYTPDGCRSQFTPGQSRRMNLQWAAFRGR